MAKDALGLYIVSAEEDGEELKKPSKLNAIKLTIRMMILFWMTGRYILEGIT